MGAVIQWEGYNLQFMPQIISEGDKVQYKIILLSEPYNQVVFNIGTRNTSTTSSTSQSPSLSATTLTFSSTNWNVPQDITITTIHDEIDGELEKFEIYHQIDSTDTKYNSLAPMIIALDVNDIDTAGVEFDRSSIGVKEGGNRVSFA